MVRKNLWIQKAKPKKGALSRQLGIPIKDNIPNTLLFQIQHSPVGSVIVNRYKGKKTIKVTPLLKKRVNLAITLKSLRS